MGNRAVKVLNFGVVGSTSGSEKGPESKDARTRRFGVFELDLRAGELRRNGIKVKLQEQPFQVLAQLLETPGEVVTREDIRNRLWPADTFVDFDHSLNAAIKRLRDALGDSAENPIFVETVARRGYRFLAPVATTAANGNGGIAVALSTMDSSAAVLPVALPRHSRFWWIAAAVSAVVLVLVGVKLGLLLSSRPAPAVQPRVTRLTANPANDPVRSAGISRDGKYLVFSDETGLYLRQIDTSETHSLSLPPGFKAGSVSWFPDSVHMIAALWNSEQHSSLWEISALGGSPRLLSEEGNSPSVSPDGKSIAFITGKRMREQVWLMAADGSQPHKLVGDEGDFFGSVAWSPDSTRLVYTRGRFAYGFGVKGTIEFFDLRSQHVASLPNINTVHWLSSLNGPLTWADGHLIFTLTEPPPRQLDSNLWSIVIDPGGHAIGDPVRLTSDPGAVSRISASSDGKRVVYVKGVPQPDVYIARLQGHEIVGEPERLTLDDRQDLPFDWTPDNKSVIFISDRTGVFSIYRQAIDQTVPELLVGSKGPVTNPRLSPDGTQLLYLVDPSWYGPESGSSSSITLMRVALAGGAPQRVLQAEGITNQQCSRAPATLCLYSVIGSGGLTFFGYDPMNGSGGQVYQIKDDVPQLYNWSLSPDGNTLAIARGKQGDQDPQIHLVSLKTGAERVITVRGWPGLASLDWAADSKSLWAPSLADEENPLLNIDLQGNARPVWRPKKLNANWAIPSRDGKYLALHVSSNSANVWMLERP